jgi:hypothetical protein
MPLGEGKTTAPEIDNILNIEGVADHVVFDQTSLSLQ